MQVRLVAKGQAKVADISISGLPGWVTVEVPSGRGEVQLTVWAPAGVEVFVRPPIPVGDTPFVRNSETHLRDSDPQPQNPSPNPPGGEHERGGLDARRRDSRRAQKEYLGRRGNSSRGPKGPTADSSRSPSWYEGSPDTPGGRSRGRSGASFERKRSGSRSPSVDSLQWDDV